MSTPVSLEAERTRRQRWPRNLGRLTPKPFPWADKEHTWNGASAADWFEAIFATNAYQTIVRPRLAEVTAGMDPRSRWIAEELEAVYMFRSLSKHDSVTSARHGMTAERGDQLCLTLGFDHDREFRTNFQRVKRRNLPSVATLSRLRTNHLSAADAAAMWKECFEAIVCEHLDRFPEMREESRTLFADGTPVGTRYTPPRRDPDTGEIVNAEQVTFPDGGFQARPDPTKSGPGLTHVNLLTCRGLPLAFHNAKRHDHEPVGLQLILRNEFTSQLRPASTG